MSSSLIEIAIRSDDGDVFVEVSERAEIILCGSSSTSGLKSHEKFLLRVRALSALSESQLRDVVTTVMQWSTAAEWPAIERVLRQCAEAIRPLGSALDHAIEKRAAQSDDFIAAAPNSTRRGKA